MSHSAICVLNPFHSHDEGHGDQGEPEHLHGLIDPTITRSKAGIRAVSISLAVLTITAVAQTLIYALTLSVALLADLIHNFGDASTAIPLGLGGCPARRGFSAAVPV